MWAPTEIVSAMYLPVSLGCPNKIVVARNWKTEVSKTDTNQASKLMRYSSVSLGFRSLALMETGQAMRCDTGRCLSKLRLRRVGASQQPFGGHWKVQEHLVKLKEGRRPGGQA